MNGSLLGGTPCTGIDCLRRFIHGEILHIVFGRYFFVCESYYTLESEDILSYQEHYMRLSHVWASPLQVVCLAIPKSKNYGLWKRNFGEVSYHKDMYSKMYLDKANIQQSKWCVKTAGKKIIMLYELYI